MRMRLSEIHLERYRKAKDLRVEIPELLVLIGPNGSGKSNLVDCLRFAQTATNVGDFSAPLAERGGFTNLPWKGETASRVMIRLTFDDDKNGKFEWRTELRRAAAYDVNVQEDLHHFTSAGPVHLLHKASATEQWWCGLSDGNWRRESLSLRPHECALSAASKNAAFPGRGVFEFVRNWVFADPNPGYLRQPSSPDKPDALDFLGRNLAARLNALQALEPVRFEKVSRIFHDITGMHALTGFEVKTLEDGRLALAIRETGLSYPLNQPALSSGTLRIIALATALADAERTGLLAMEEPENYVHPSALEGLVQHLLAARERTQVIITTHSPVLLDYLRDVPECVRVVAGGPGEPTTVRSGPSRDAILKALEESGFSLGDLYMSQGFKGSN